MSNQNELLPGLDYIANFLNALDTEGMTVNEVRSAIYSECLEPCRSADEMSNAVMNDLRAQLTAAKAEREGLREALRPFANLSFYYPEPLSDELPVSGTMVAKIGDLRRAAKALQETRP